MARRWAALVLVLGGLAVLWGGNYVLDNLKINTDTTDMLSPDLPFRQNSNELSKAFPQFSDNLVVVLEGTNPDLLDDGAQALAARIRQQPQIFGPLFDPAGLDFFRTNGLLYMDVEELEDLTASLARAQPFLGTLWRDASLPRLFELLGQALETKDQAKLPQLDAMLDAITTTLRAQMEGRPGRLSWQRLMQGKEPSQKTARRIMVLKPRLDFASLRPGEESMEKLRAIARDLRLSENFGVRMRLTGSVALAHEELASVVDGLGLAGLVSLTLVLGLLLWGLRSPRLVLATLVTLIAGLIWTATFAIAVIGTFNLISVAFAVLFIGLSVDFGIHFCLRYKEEIQAEAGTPAALRGAAEKIGGALSLTALAAGIGFFSFLPTDYLGLAELGVIAGTGMGIALFCNLTLLPAMIALLPPGPGNATRPAAHFFDLKAMAGQHRRAILGLAALAGLAAAIALPQARFDFDPLNLKDRSTESVATLFDLMEDRSQGPYSITVLTPGPAQAEAIAKKLSGLPEVDGTTSLAQFIPKNQARKLEMIESAAFFLAPALADGNRAPPPTDEARAKSIRDLMGKLDGASALAKTLKDFTAKPVALTTLETRLLTGLPGRLLALRQSLDAEEITLKTLPPGLIRRQVAEDGRARLEVHPKEDLRDRNSLAQFVRAVRAHAPQATGAPVVILEAGQAVLASFFQAGLLTLLAITLVLALLFARLREILLIFAPLVLAGLLTVAAGLIFDLPFNFANVIVLPLLFGLGVAGGVHFVSRERAGGDTQAVLASSTPRAVTFSALTTIGSFGSIALSSHPGTASMGLLLTIAIILVLISTLLVLPALMATWPASRRPMRPI